MRQDPIRLIVGEIPIHASQRTKQV
jgi:hypothetical protein